MRPVALVVGVITTSWVLLALLTNMLVPRSTNLRLARALNALVWQAAVAPLSLLRTYPRQDRWLAGAAPVAVLLQLIAYAVALVLTLGLFVYGTTDLSWNQAFYQSGATFTTLGVVVPSDSAGTAVSFLAAFLGLVVIGIFVGYLISLYSAYNARESLMVRLATEAGEPAWGPELVARSHALGAEFGSVPAADRWIDWVTQLRTGQQVTPVLGQFRSTASTRHWVISLLAVLDATALQAALRPASITAQQIKLLAVGADTFRALASESGRDLADIKQVEGWVLAAMGGTRAELSEAQLTADEWEAGAQCMTETGAATSDEVAEARGRFCAIRSLYAASAHELAESFHAVPAPWSVPPSPPSRRLHPRLGPRPDGEDAG